MTTNEPSLAADPAAGAPLLGPTLADALARMPDLAEVSAQIRQNLASALRTLARVLDRPPSQIPIAAPILRRLIAEASPGAIGLSASRWRNVRYEVGRAIHLSGLETEPPKQPTTLPEIWENLALRGPTPVVRSVLRRFARFCWSLGLPPERVAKESFESFEAYLDASQLSRFPARIAGDTLRAWNRYVAVDERLPKIAIVDRSRRYSVDWADMLPSLAADVAAFHEASLRPDVLRAGAPSAVKASTIGARDRLLRRMVAGQLARGVAKADLRRLADVVELGNIEQALRFLLARNGGEKSQQLWEAVSLALVIARHWVKAEESTLTMLIEWEDRVRPRRRGLTEKNKALLRQFAQEKVQRALAMLPDTILAKVSKAPMDTRTALRVQTALAIAMLTVAPMRLGNLLRLDRERHFVWAFSAAERHRHLIVPAAEVKNDVDLDFPLPKHVADLVELYFRKYQPLLTGGAPSSLFFPGRGDRPKQDSALRKQISATIYAEIGVKMHPHLFRHLAALVFLQHHPGDYETVRRFLGHKSLATTLNCYAGLETAAAARRYDAVILGIRDGRFGPELPELRP